MIDNLELAQAFGTRKLNIIKFKTSTMPVRMKRAVSANGPTPSAIVGKIVYENPPQSAIGKMPSFKAM